MPGFRIAEIVTKEDFEATLARALQAEEALALAKQDFDVKLKEQLASNESLHQERHSLKMALEHKTAMQVTITLLVALATIR